MAKLTSPDKLNALADTLELQAGRIDATRVRLMQQVEATEATWQGKVADAFRRHAGARHRQHHLDVAHDKLRYAALLARSAAAENAARITQLAGFETAVRDYLEQNGGISHVDLPPRGDTRWADLYRDLVEDRDPPTTTLTAQPQPSPGVVQPAV